MMIREAVRVVGRAQGRIWARVTPRHLGFWSLTLAVGAFMSIPLSLMLLTSLRDIDPTELQLGFGNLTLDNYTRAYSSLNTFRFLLNSFWFAGGAMLVGITIGTGLAFLYERTDFRFRAVLPVLAIIPLATPGIVDAIAWVFLLSPTSGLLNQWWRMLGGEGALLSAYSVPAMIWVQGYGMITLTFLLVGSIMRRMDPALEEAAQAAGAPMPKVMFRVTLPLIWPGILAVSLLLFVRGIEAFEIPLILGFTNGIFVFSTRIFFALRGNFPPDWGAGFAFSTGILVITVFAIVLYLKQLRLSERFVVVSGKGYRPRMLRLGSGQYVALAFVVVYAFFVVVLPLFILAWASLLPYYVAPSVEALSMVTLDNYKAALTNPLLPNTLLNTFLLGTVVGVLVMLISFLASWFIFRTQLFGRFILEFLVFLPFAIPGVVIAVAVLITAITVPNPLYNTIWIIILAYTFSLLPLGTRFTHPAVVQIHRDLEDAARGSGAGFWTTMLRIWVPLIRPSLINGALYVGIVSLKVLTIALFLQGPGNRVFSVHLLSIFTNEQGEAAALSVMFVLFVAVLTIVATSLRHRQEAQEGLAST